MPVEFENSREILPKIGDKIRKLRMSKNLSQSQLAFEVGTTLRQIQRIEVGTVNAGILYYIQIAKVLDIEFHDFFESL
ncbi:helix-turn-helix transcriptional regulator [Crocinitomicaceae bacterium CZZ-1]|uniref:Helix-turn-helix transcriptional regulator n=1 Tax=Taishania pollutisoli TaxID=2766479 RepID=A0A8J6PNR8_9FLAO|nr:helix-turn-helix transcriptional regulator [Taishania pollutisoli]MBC9811868.1 helix-turn-helix transcriptional regulator [Taishania pollutisoli]MBX2948190.1 helix-turn-helix transcriptional regulator [Crocinitomicaceae bacterium]NGF75295.1 helix-turn-helix transcriptional regulator [Fluviicola sp. SGL-29]